MEEITEGEVMDAIKKIAARKAPGLDEIAGRIWSLARDVLGDPSGYCLVGA